ncbi:MAG: TetR/AcrR family transcriptional regulator [Candidatus Nanohaloarchaea archaeon]|nr:TetR/AcrR family transcriptional regulator [Candidatus Nanohaloarchaea archaeon]
MGEGSDTRDQIMDATYRALCEHGYADLTIERIADEFEKGKSVIYYHFDDKDDLMVSFLDHLHDRISKDLEGVDCDCQQSLDNMLEMALGLNDEETWAFRTALFEMQSDAPYNDALATRFQDIHDQLMDLFADILDDLDVQDSEQEAEMLFYTIEGIVSTRITEGRQDDMEALKDRLVERYAR